MRKYIYIRPPEQEPIFDSMQELHNFCIDWCNGNQTSLITINPLIVDYIRLLVKNDECNHIIMIEFQGYILREVYQDGTLKDWPESPLDFHRQIIAKLAKKD